MLDVGLITLGDPGRLSGGYLYHRRLAERAPGCGARLRFASVPERSFPLAALQARATLRRASGIGANALVVDSIAAAFVAPWLNLLPSWMPLVAILHQPPGGIDHGRLRASVQRLLDRRTYARCVRLLAASQALAAQLEDEGLPSEKIIVVPPGRDVAPDAIACAVDLRQGRRAALLCVGNWVERKGIHSLLEAFAMLPQGSATLHLVGDDHAETPYAARVRRRLMQPDLAGRVVVHGPVSVERVRGFYEAADVFVLPSLREPYGTVYGEAMSCGLPVVGWRAGNLPHLARDGQEGLVVEPGDLPGLARALERLIEDEALRRQMGQAARQRAASRPTWDETARMFFQAIRDVLGATRERQLTA